ncbi:MAG: hypothetical protein HC871_08235, partial [Rhizobiales bacterium]|nr:hypothetical protein [Hyphomicrobiales bacterium]
MRQFLPGETSNASPPIGNDVNGLVGEMASGMGLAHLGTMNAGLLISTIDPLGQQAVIPSGSAAGREGDTFAETLQAALAASAMITTAAVQPAAAAESVKGDAPAAAPGQTAGLTAGDAALQAFIRSGNGLTAVSNALKASAGVDVAGAGNLPGAGDAFSSLLRSGHGEH